MAWNKPNVASQPVKKSGAKAPSKVKGIVAGLVTVCALGGLCLWLFSGSDGVSKSKATKERSRIREVTPAAAPKASDEVVTDKLPPPKKLPGEETYIDSHGVERYKLGNARVPKKEFDPKHVVPTAMTSTLPKFKHKAEREIAILLTWEPGETRHGTTEYDAKFEADLKASFSEPIEYDKDESREDRELRIQVQQAKEEIAQRMKNGESLDEIFEETQKEMRRLATYKRDILRLVREQALQSEGAPTAKDIQDYYNAANQMLKEQGIEPVTPSKLLIRRVCGDIESLKENKESKDE